VELNWSRKVNIRKNVLFLGVTPISFVDYSYEKLKGLSHFIKS